MKINVKTFGRSNEHFDVIVRTKGASIHEEWLTREEAEELAVRFLDDTAFGGLHRHEIVGKLVQLNIIDEDMIREWLHEQDESYR